MIWAVLGLLCALSARAADVSYFLEGSSSIVLSHGELDGSGTLQPSDTGIIETVQIPRLGNFFAHGVDIASQIDASVLRFGFAFAQPDLGEWLRITFSYQYQFMGLGSWRPGIGAGYSFARYDVPNVVSVQGRPNSDALFSGTGFDGALSLDWVSRHLRLGVVTRYRWLSFGRITTEGAGFAELDKALGQGMMEAGLRAGWAF